MVFIKKQIVNDIIYYLLVKNERTKNKIEQNVLKRFRNYVEMYEYCKKHNIKTPEQELINIDLQERLLSKLKKLNSFRPLLTPTLESLKKKFEVNMTYNSNAIEGNRLSLKETYLVLEKGLTIHGKSVKEHLEATNHKEAIEEMEKLIYKKITEEDVLKLHQIILDKIKPKFAGVYRNGPVAITLSDHKPPKHTEIPKLMKQVFDLINNDSKGIDAIITASKIHHLFVFIHPFWDGNGRLGRLLMDIKIMQAGFPPVVLRKKDRPYYYEVLEDADKGDLAPLTTMIAKNAEISLDLYLKVLED